MNIKIKARKLYLEGKSTREVAKILTKGNATIYRWCKDIIRKNSDIDRNREKNPNFKGGHINKEGYKILCINSNYIKEHTYVMEKHLGRKLKADELVHHINHIKSDNRIENLQLTDRYNHQKLHAKKTEPKVCPICKEAFMKKSNESHKVWENRITCSRKCSSVKQSESMKGNNYASKHNIRTVKRD